jgi:PadR family transcriptional regulator PadR
VTEIRTSTYFILAALLDGPLHGYAIAARARELSGGEVRLTAGTLYGALERLAEQGLVAVADEAIVNGRARRTYRLQEGGRTLLAAEAERLAAASRVVRTRLTPAQGLR